MGDYLELSCSDVTYHPGIFSIGKLPVLKIEREGATYIDSVKS